jgi:REP element-mobilizing transposase RayT
MVENEFGKIVRDEWKKTASIRPYVVLDAFSVMPNHVHVIIHLTKCRGTARRAPTEQFGKPTVRAFKSAISKRVHETGCGFKWQRNYYEHVIRDEKSIFFIRKYIHENPMAWGSDSENHIDHEIREFEMSEIEGAK